MDRARNGRLREEADDPGHLHGHPKAPAGGHQRWAVRTRVQSRGRDRSCGPRGGAGFKARGAVGPVSGWRVGTVEAEALPSRSALPGELA